ncbi:threonine/serine exporter family protein [Actinomyces polynesiensis]|uniref:threonine/serine exporter family protein n=1 Tax=Actinomyces polynesiensis TaxID=1325934 RepID=UPI0011C90A3B|nr:threonine/serine exporter family protein [Actinomyces polynesiensis]
MAPRLEDPLEERLEFLLQLGCGLLESGQTAASTRYLVATCGRGLGLQGMKAMTRGRMLRVGAQGSDGTPRILSAPAGTFDVIDCTRARDLARLVEEVDRPDAEPLTGPEAESFLANGREEVQRLRSRGTPWWVVTLGLTLLAFFISMQVGINWRAWVAAAVVQVASSLVGFAVAPLRAPRLVVVAAQACAGGALATALVRMGLVDPVGAAAAIAVNWLLLLPLPQMVNAVMDLLSFDRRMALVRLSRVALAVGGLVIGGAFTFLLGESLGMAHPRLDTLPGMPWYLVLVFSALAAVGNAFANGGRFSLAVPAAVTGFATAGVNQVLLLVVGLPTLAANTISAFVLGILAGIYAVRAGYPQQVLALMGITGALLPGIPVFFGILQEMGQGSGLPWFGQAALIMLGIGVGVGIGSFLYEAVRLAALWVVHKVARVGRRGKVAG